MRPCPRPFKFPPDTATLHEFYPHQHTAPHIALNSILHPEECYLPYRVEAWMSVGGNPIRQNAQPEKYVEGFKKLSFVLTIAFHMDEVAILSDVLLPEHSALERLRVVPFYLQHQSIDDEVSGLKMIQFGSPCRPCSTPRMPTTSSWSWRNGWASSTGKEASTTS